MFNIRNDNALLVAAEAHNTGTSVAGRLKKLYESGEISPRAYSELTLISDKEEKKLLDLIDSSGLQDSEMVDLLKDYVRKAQDTKFDKVSLNEHAKQLFKKLKTQTSKIVDEAQTNYSNNMYNDVKGTIIFINDQKPIHNSCTLMSDSVDDYGDFFINIPYKSMNVSDFINAGGVMTSVIKTVIWILDYLKDCSDNMLNCPSLIEAQKILLLFSNKNKATHTPIGGINIQSENVIQFYKRNTRLLKKSKSSSVSSLSSGYVSDPSRDSSIIPNYRRKSSTNRTRKSNYLTIVNNSKPSKTRKTRKTRAATV